MPDMESVAAARKKVAGAYKDWLKETYETQLSEMGSKKTREQMPSIEPSGAWSEPGKTLAWIVEFAFDHERGKWSAGVTASSYPNRLGGSFNAKSPLQGVLSRILPVMRLSESPRRAVPHRYWEWALALVFPGRPVFRSTGSSGAVIDFNPADGALTSPIDGVVHSQPYVSAALFKLVPGDDVWAEADLTLTYDQATEALQNFINVNPADPATAGALGQV